jgi:hypothetical protein
MRRDHEAQDVHLVHLPTTPTPDNARRVDNRLLVHSAQRPRCRGRAQVHRPRHHRGERTDPRRGDRAATCARSSRARRARLSCLVSGRRTLSRATRSVSAWRQHSSLRSTSTISRSIAQREPGSASTSRSKPAPLARATYRAHRRQVRAEFHGLTTGATTPLDCHTSMLGFPREQSDVAT